MKYPKKYGVKHVNGNGKMDSASAPPTKKQVQFIRELSAQLGISNPVIPKYKKGASEKIERLKEKL